MDTDGYSTAEGTASFIVTHTNGDEVVTDEYPDFEDASARAEEVYRNGEFPVTIDSTHDGTRWAYGTDGQLAPAPGG